VIGILDWELCTLGSPLADLGNLLLPFSITPTSAEDADKLMGRSKTPSSSPPSSAAVPASPAPKAHAASIMTPPSDIDKKLDKHSPSSPNGRKKEQGDKKEKKGRADMTLLVGLHGLSTQESGLPDVREIEGWWVRDMNDGARWHAQRAKSEKSDGSERVVRWQTPIFGMG
jgi:hypothetical protein